MVHPYVFSKSGFDEEGALSPPWNIRHAWFETLLDLAFLEERGVHLRDIRPWCMMSVSAIDLISMSSFIGSLFADSLDENSYRESCLDMSAVYRMLHDPGGWKRKLAEKTGKAETLIGAFIAPQRLSVGQKDSILGLDGESWPDPVSGLERNESFRQLYEKGLEGLDPLNEMWIDLTNAKEEAEALDEWIDSFNHDGKEPEAQRRYYKT